MPRLWTTRLLLALFAGIALGCQPGEPLAPPTTARPVDLVLGDTTPTLTLDTGHLSRAHHLTVPDTTEVAVFVQALDSALRLRIFVDNIDVGASYYLYAVDPHLLANRTERFRIPAGKTLNVFLSRPGTVNPSPLRYRLFVYPVNRKPEHGLAPVTLDQVRDNEDLETSADIDEFALAGQKGKNVVGYLSNLGPSGSGSFALGFVAEDNINLLSSVSAPDVGVLLGDIGTSPYTVAVAPQVVRVEGTSNLPSSYAFVVRPAPIVPELPPAGAAW